MSLLPSCVVAMMVAMQPAAAPPLPPATPLPAAIEREAKAIEKLVIAPCCWMQPVSDHQSPASDEAKQQIRAWLAEGMTRQQVLDGFVVRYGTRVLAEPPNRGFSRFLYVTPIALFGLSAVGLVVLVRRMTAGSGTPAGRSGAPPEAARRPADAPAGRSANGAEPTDADYEEKLDDELREMG
jgi:cytochrome c-type biogenesis protein CcmH/NrfF